MHELMKAHGTTGFLLGVDADIQGVLVKHGYACSASMCNSPPHTALLMELIKLEHHVTMSNFARLAISAIV